MVLPGERDYMETGPERSKTLHNFTLPNLKWGNQRHLRCMKVDSASGGGGSSGAGDHRLRRRSLPLKFDNSSDAIPVRLGDADQRSNNQRRRLRTAPSRSAENGSEEGIEEFREKIMSDLRTVADKMTESILRKQALGDEDEEEQTDGGGEEKDRRMEKQEEKEKEKQKEREFSPATAAASSSEVRPWNLRTRRAACKAPIPGAGNSNGNQYNGFNHNNKGLKIEERRVNPLPLRNDSAKSPRVRERGGVMVAVTGAEMKERPKFSLPLTRKEIEEDFMEFLGHRPPRRPKKRLKTVQKPLDFLFPGVFLTEVTLETYKVPESVENGKR